MRLNKKNNKGFTLVEVVMVVAILGILSSLAIGKYSKTQETARQNADYVAATSIATAAGIAISDKVDASTSITLASLVTEGYLTNIPKPQSVSGDFILDTTNRNITVKVGSVQFYPRIQTSSK